MMRQFRGFAGLMLAAAATAGTGCQAVRIPPSAPTPQRPTLSADTSTTRHGTAELEAGIGVDPHDATTLPTSLKFGIAPETELFWSWTPFQWVRQPGPDARGQGDTAVGFRHRFQEEVDLLPSAALQLTTKLPTASAHRGLGSGELDWSAAGILTRSVGAGSATAYYELGALGEAGDQGVDFLHSVALAGGYPLVERLSGFLEIAAQVSREQNHESVFSTLGVAYPVMDSLVLDAAVITGFTDDAPDFQLVAGFTMNLGGWSVEQPGD